jgi:hypothetical protein
LKVGWASIILVVVGIFANPQSAQLKRWAARHQKRSYLDNGTFGGCFWPL